MLLIIANPSPVGL